MTNSWKVLVLVGLLLAFGVPAGTAVAQEVDHYVHVEFEGGGFAEGIWIVIWVKIGPNTWDYRQGQTDVKGDFWWTVEPNTTATYWYAGLDSGETPVFPVSYTQVAFYDDDWIDWIIEP